MRPFLGMINWAGPAAGSGFPTKMAFKCVLELQHFIDLPIAAALLRICLSLLHSLIH